MQYYDTFERSLKVTFTFRARVMQHKLQKDDSVFSQVEFIHPGNKYTTQDVIVPMKFPLASIVYISVSDSEPEGGASE